MIRKNIYLQDNAFLKEIAGLHIKEYFVKITVLNWKEDPIQDIQGKVISASLNIDGNSIIRRTATISVAIDETNNDITSTKNLLSINKKVNLQIGFINDTKKYKDFPILWFPFGVYVITDNSISYSNTGLVASLQLKDKMCLLNGDCGGTFPASVIFDNYSTIDENGQEVIERPTIYQIIQQLVNHFGGQQLGKIIISDLDNRVKQVMKWTGTSPLYVFLNNNQYIYTLQQNSNMEVPKDWPDIKTIFSYGEDVGYIYTDFTYPGDLIGDAGNTVTDILQEIKNVLGNFEYFYNIDGNFIFREKKNYLNNAQSKYLLDSINKNNEYYKKNNESLLMVPDYINAISSNPYSGYLISTNNGTSAFQFEDDTLISSYSNTPKYSQIKNDFVVWGIRKTTDGIEIPLRYHLAIDKKPIPGNTYEVFEYQDEMDGLKKWGFPLKFETKAKFPTKGAANVFYCDMSNSKDPKIYKWGKDENDEFNYILMDTKLESIVTTDWRTELLFQGLVANVLGTESNYYFAELFNQWPALYDIRNHEFFEDAVKNASDINYFLDFIDSPSAAVGQLSVENIGRRTKVLNEQSNVNCVFQAWIPDIVFIKRGQEDTDTRREECQARGQNYCQIDATIYDSLQMGGSKYSAYEEIRQTIHEYTKYNESISIQTLPIYHLEPNTRITVKNKESNIYGDYMIESLSFTFDNSSMLTINATRAPEKI